MGRNLEIKRPIQVSKYHAGDMGEDKGPLRLPGLLLLPGQYLCASGFCISGACVAKFDHSRSSSMRALLHLTMDGTHTRGGFLIPSTLLRPGSRSHIPLARRFPQGMARSGTWRCWGWGTGIQLGSKAGAGHSLSGREAQSPGGSLLVRPKTCSRLTAITLPIV